MRSNATRLTWVAVLVLALGTALLPLGCAAEEPAFTGVHSTPAARDPRWLPDDIVEQLRACAEKLPAALPGERTEHLVGFDVQAGRGGAIDRVTLKRSTLGDQGVKACMAEVLSGMTLPIADLAPLLAAGGGKHSLSPEARGLLGGGPLLGSIALLPAVLTIARVVIVVAVVVYVSYEVVQAIDAYARSTTTIVAAAAPSATAVSEEVKKTELYDGNAPIRPSAKPDFLDPSKAPSADWQWKGRGAPGIKGNWINPKTGEKLNPDLAHPPPIGPHYDYTDGSGREWRVFEDGRILPQ